MYVLQIFVHTEDGQCQPTRDIFRHRDNCTALSSLLSTPRETGGPGTSSSVVVKMVCESILAEEISGG